MKTTLNCIVRIAIIVLLIYQVGVFKFLGSLPNEERLPIERERFLIDSLREVAKPIVARADSLANKNQYTVYMYFDDMTNLRLIENKVGFKAYSVVLALGTINHLLNLSYKTNYSREELKKAQDAFLPRIDPDYGKPVPPINWPNVFMTILFWLITWYLKFLPYALTWYGTQLVADKDRILYLRKHPLRVLAMLLIYPYTLLWGILRRAGDTYAQTVVMAELGRRGIKASRKDVKYFLSIYQSSGLKSLREFFDDRGIVAQRSLLVGLCVTIFSNICLPKNFNSFSIERKFDRSVIENTKGPPVVYSFTESGDSHSVVFFAETVCDEIVIYLTGCITLVRRGLFKLLYGFPNKIGHVPLCNVFFSKNAFLKTQTHEKNKNNNNNNNFLCNLFGLRTEGFYYLEQVFKSRVAPLCAT